MPVVRSELLSAMNHLKLRAILGPVMRMAFKKRQTVVSKREVKFQLLPRRIQPIEDLQYLAGRGLHFRGVLGGNLAATGSQPAERRPQACSPGPQLRRLLGGKPKRRGYDSRRPVLQGRGRSDRVIRGHG